jgi:transcriptional regulator with GAF, ATPase, and Fis domain
MPPERLRRAGAARWTCRVGESQLRTARVKVIGAANRDLRAPIRAGCFFAEL